MAEGVYGAVELRYGCGLKSWEPEGQKKKKEKDRGKPSCMHP
jgi:hypothetical protein